MASNTKSILFLTYGGWQHASSRIRALNYIKKLKLINDYQIKWLPRAPERGSSFLEQLLFFVLKRYFFLRRLFYLLFYSWDIVFIQRVFLSSFLIKIIAWKKIPFVYDFDDALYLGNRRNYNNTLRLIQKAKKTIVSSPVLADFCETHGVIPDFIPSPIDEEVIKPRKLSSENKEIVNIGWIGSPWTEHYLLNIQEALVEVARKCKICLSLIGASKTFNINGVFYESHDWRLERENELLQNLDIGIMPLHDDEWSKGKGGYKIYQYMASGLPVIASPVGINNEIIDHGMTGFLANTHEEWVKYLILLIKDHSLREKMGRAGRVKFEKKYSYQVCVPIFNKIIKETICSQVRKSQESHLKGKIL